MGPGRAARPGRCDRQLGTGPAAPEEIQRSCTVNTRASLEVLGEPSRSRALFTKWSTARRGLLHDIVCPGNTFLCDLVDQRVGDRPIGPAYYRPIFPGESFSSFRRHSGP
jgi:hypothetical protein